MATKTRRRGGAVKERVFIRGFTRIQITTGDPRRPETIRIVGDSGVDADGNLINGDGLSENQVCATGIQQYMALTLAGSAGSKTVSHIALGTGGAPATNDTALAGEITHSASSRTTVSPTTAASGAGYNVSFLATFASSASFLTASANLSNVGLFNTSTTAVGTLLAGNTYASSAVATNNNVNVTHAVKFATA